MSREQRDKLQSKEQSKNPGAILNNTFARALTGSPDGGCLINLLSIVMILILIFIVKACTN